jgi:hypothetical protein
MHHWIDCNDYDTKIGTIGYLVETHHERSVSLSLRDRPLRTNQSHVPRLAGWCGETDNRSRYARGVWRVERTNAAGDRAKIVPIVGAELAAFLEADGYPELTPAESIGA